MLAMDRALWISWYDLPEERREEYLSWLHDSYLPAMAKRRGILWAAHYASIAKTGGRNVNAAAGKNNGPAGVPTGDRYILMLGAEDVNVFGAPTVTEINGELPQTDRAMLALRSGERVNVMTEAARVDGPAAPGYKDGMKPAPFIQLGSYNYDWREEQDMLAWYAQWRMPAMQSLTGMVRTRKLASVVGWAKHAILYEWTSREAKDKSFSGHENGRPDMKAWSDRIVPRLQHAPGSSNVACRTWPS